MAATESPPTPIDNQKLEEESKDSISQVDKSTAPPPLHEHDAENAINSNPLSSDAPDGGVIAWLVILGVWCCSFCSFGWMNSIGVFQEYYQDKLLLGYSSSTISWIPSLQILFVMGAGPFVGIIYDIYGTRWLLLIGSFMHVFGIMMASISTKFYQVLLAQGFCSAIGCGMLFQPSITAATGWFHRKRGVAFGVAFTGSSLGGVIFPIMVSYLIQEVGFGWAMRICAFLILFLLVIANLTVRPFKPSHPHKITFAQLNRPLKEIQFLLVMGGFFFFCYGYFVPLNYLPIQAVGAGMSANLQPYLLSILNAASLFGRLAAGFIGDKIGRFNVFIIVCYLSAMWILVLWLLDSTDAALITFAILFGFFSGAFISLATPLIALVSPMSELGFRVGMVLFSGAVAGLTTNPINGAIVDSSGGWTSVKIFSGVFCLVGATLVLLVRMKRAGMNLFVNI